jgi:hypothetical protein
MLAEAYPLAQVVPPDQQDTDFTANLHYLMDWLKRHSPATSLRKGQTRQRRDLSSLNSSRLAPE